jgi:hypothetical protein
MLRKRELEMPTNAGPMRLSANSFWEVSRRVMRVESLEKSARVLADEAQYAEARNVKIATWMR